MRFFSVPSPPSRIPPRLPGAAGETMRRASPLLSTLSTFHRCLRVGAGRYVGRTPRRSWHRENPHKLSPPSCLPVLFSSVLAAAQSDECSGLSYSSRAFDDGAAAPFDLDPFSRGAPSERRSIARSAFAGDAAGPRGAGYAGAGRIEEAH